MARFLPLIISLSLIAALATITGVIKRLGYHISYSATLSMPKGFYLVTPTKEIKREDVVEFKIPNKVKAFAKKNRWIPQSGSIIKYVLGVPQDHVCIHDNSIWINHKSAGTVHKFYDQNKLLPQTQFCGKLTENQYILLSTKHDRSFDSRYFGPVSSQEILGKATPIFMVPDTVSGTNNFEEK